MQSVTRISVGERVFTGVDWRKGLLHYLHEIWKGEDATALPLKLDEVTLVLINIPHVERRYFVYGQVASEQRRGHSFRKSVTQLVAGCEEYDLPEGLIRFVKNDQLKRLGLFFGMTDLYLTKGPRRGQLMMSGCISSTLVKATDGYVGPRLLRESDSD